MFEEFSKRKCEEYLKQVEFTDDKTYYQNIRQSNLPPYIINFFDCTIKHKKIALNKEEFEKLLQNAIVFNINYVIKPKATLLKFLFGSTDARPTDYVIERLGFFQFYRYYTDAIIEFIQLHSPPVISITQVEKLIDEINKKILLEVSDEESSDTQRLNLIKLLYYFFIDLTENNPINIKLPKSILSTFMQDKRFYKIKKRADSFFKEDIFIQEAVDLMKQMPLKQLKEEEQTTEKDESRAIEENLKSLKSAFLDTEITAREINKTKPGEEGSESSSELFENKSSNLSEAIPKSEKNILDKDIYSEELLTISATDESRPDDTLTEENWKKKVQEDLFCEVNYRKRILKKIFRKDENQFNELVSKLLDINNWETATEFIDSYFSKNKIDYYSEEAVKFVDVMHDYYNHGKGNDDSAIKVS